MILASAKASPSSSCHGRGRRARPALCFVLAAGALLGCGASNASTTVTCGSGRTVLDGVCVDESVADYVACVRAQGAQIGSAQSQKLAADVGAFGVKAGGAREVSAELQKKYSVSDAATIAIVETCNKAAGLRAERRSGAAAVLEREWNGRRYARVERAASWHEAEAECKKLGADLASIVSAEENTFVFQAFAGCPTPGRSRTRRSPSRSASGSRSQSLL